MWRFFFILKQINSTNMRTKNIIFLLSLLILCNCSKKADYTPDFIQKTSGRYLYTDDEIFEVYYENENLYLKWRGAERLKPVAVDQNTIFVADMYKKLRFVEHPDSKRMYLGTVNPENESEVSYDYLKLADSEKIPSTHLKDGDFDKALEGYLKIREKDSTSELINEREFNQLGYQYIRQQKLENAIDVFKLNVALYPNSSNVYDSLADAYVRNGDSLETYNNFKKALELNTGNRRAKEFVEAFKE